MRKNGNGGNEMRCGWLYIANDIRRDNDNLVLKGGGGERERVVVSWGIIGVVGIVGEWGHQMRQEGVFFLII